MRSKIGKLWMALLCTTLAMTQLPVTILADSSAPPPAIIEVSNDDDIDVIEEDDSGSVIVEEQVAEPMDDDRTEVVNAENTKVLTVQFDNNGNGGTNYDNNDMKTAIGEALNNLAQISPGSGKTTITTIKLTGTAKEITDSNWRYLIEQYQDSSDWTTLTALDLSGMTKLALIRDDEKYTSFQRARLSTLMLPDSLTEIGNCAFNKCINLELQTLPSKITQLGNSAFGGCAKLALTKLPLDLTTIGNSAFYDCAKLALAELPSNLTNIGRFAFSGCTNLALTQLPSGIAVIMNSTFQSCTSLALTQLPSKLTNIESFAFQNCTSLALTQLPSKLTSIEISAFSGCTNLALTQLPSNLTIIGTSAFSGCTNLALTQLPSNLTSIGTSAFYGCTNLALTQLPSNLTSIGTSAFYGCSNLKQIIMEPIIAPTLNGNAFANTNPNLLFFVPKEGKGYDKDGWEKLKTQKYAPTLGISLDPLTLYPNAGQNSAKLKAKLEPDDAVPILLWTSSDTGIVTVDDAGMVTAVSIGAATITATSLQGRKTATCTVTVSSYRPHSHYFGSEWMHSTTQHWKECSCGAKSQIADHDYGSWSVTRETDGDTPGTCSRTCSTCGYEQTETVTYRTLTNPDTGITVSGYFTSDAALSVKEAVLHEAGACPACDRIRAGQDEGSLLLLYDISLFSGIHDGKVEVTIPVDKKYNGRSLILLHCKEKAEETLETEVKDGFVSGTFASLSPFAVLDTKKVESILLNPSSLTLELGKSRQLAATVTPSDAHNKNVTWKTSNKNVATVSASGQVKAVKAGTATITCTAADGGGAKVTCKVTVRNTATPLIILKGSAGKNSIRLNWNQISNADGYEIYSSRCGGTYNYKKIKTITKGTTTTWTQSKLKAATAYKYYIKAYKLANGRKLYLRTSKTSHVVTTGGRYTNVKSVTTTFTDITLTKGKTRQISARVTPVKKGGKLAEHVPEFRYKTTNSKVTTVTASGKIKAVGKGKCSVYVYANNGITRRVQITVK